MSELSIAYLGIPGSFSHSAAVGFFGSTEPLLNLPTFKQIFAALEKGNCAHGVVPLENSLAGSIYENYDLLRNSPLSITGEVSQKVEHNLCTIYAEVQDDNKRIAGLKRVYSHPKALEQVSNFLAEFPHIKTVATTDTASAALYIKESNTLEEAAICSKAAAEIYNLTIIRKNIEDDPLNFTRFAVLSRDSIAGLEADKCSLLMVLPHVPKSLFKSLEIVVSIAVNTTKIESRPIPGKPFEYVFYLDFEFDSADRPAVNSMLKRLEVAVAELKILGFYQKSPPRE
jgi:3-deoxy-7-phosphoheptulonate synthase